MEKENDVIEIDIVKLLMLLWSKALIIILCALICGGAAFAYARYLVEPTYQSNVLIYVNNSSISLGSASISVSSSDLSASKSLVSTYTAILKTRNTLNTVISKAKLNYSYEELSDMISASSVNNTEILKVTVTSTNAEEAASIANTIADVFPDKVANIVNGTSAKIVDYGVVNTKRVAPSYTKFALIGAFVGAAIVCIVIFIQYLMDDTFREEEFITGSFNVPILSSVPNLAMKNESHYYDYNSYNGASKKAGSK